MGPLEEEEAEVEEEEAEDDEEGDAGLAGSCFVFASASASAASVDLDLNINVGPFGFFAAFSKLGIANRFIPLAALATFAAVGFACSSLAPPLDLAAATPVGLAVGVLTGRRQMAAREAVIFFASMGMRWRRMLSPLREAAMPSMTASVAAAPSKSSSTAPGGTRSAWRACRKENHCDETPYNIL